MERMRQKIAEREIILHAGTDPDGVAMSDAQREQMRSRVDLFKAIVADFETISPVLPMLTVRDGLTFERDAGPVQIRYLGKGHTDGDLIVYLPKKRVLIAGDLLTLPVPSGSYPVEWIETLKACDIHWCVRATRGSANTSRSPPPARKPCSATRRWQ